MPKIVQNYQIQSLEQTNNDGVEFFKAKQNGSNKYFILKRLNTDFNSKSQQTEKIVSSNSKQQLFQKLIHETKILKKLENQRIPKCLRMLKTNNSMYFVYENHPNHSLKSYLQRNYTKFSAKLQFCRTIAQTLQYLHQNRIAYRSLNLSNIMIDDKGKLFFINFTQAEILQTESNQEKRLNQKKVDQKSQQLIYSDIYDAGKIFFQVLGFNELNNKLHTFKNNVQQRIFQTLSQILDKNIQSSTFLYLLKLLRQKFSSQQTQCTQTPSSPISPQFERKIKKKDSILRKSSIQKGLQKGQQSVSCSKNAMNISINKTSNIMNASTSKNNLASTKTSIVSNTKLHLSQNKLTQSKSNLPSPNSNNTRQLQQCQTPKISLKKLFSQKKQGRDKTFENLIKTRKLIHFILKCVSFAQNQKSLKLLFTLIAKIEQLQIKLEDQICILMTNRFTGSKKLFFNIIKNQYQNVNQYLKILKQSMKSSEISTPQQDNRYYFQEIQEIIRKQDSTKLQQKISIQIFHLLQNTICSLPIQTQIKKYYQSHKRFQSQLTASTKGRDIMQAQIKKDKKSPKNVNVSVSSQNLYQKIKFCYYLSIKLKYTTFEKFFDKKITSSFENLNVMKEEYFESFQTQGIPLDNLLEEIQLRILKFSKKFKQN